MTFKPKNKIQEQYRFSLAKWLKQLEKYILDGKALEYVINSKAFNELANAIASKMVTGLLVDTAKDWREASKLGGQGQRIYQLLQNEMKGPIGYKVQTIVEQNAQLIKTFPLDISEKVAAYIKEEQQKGIRATEIASKLKAQYPKIAESRINLIARTETSKASTALTEARAKNLNLNWYVWRTSEDVRVRSSHKKLEGILINWNDPPAPEALLGIKSTLGHYHAGNAPNCRCYPEPVVSIELLEFPVTVYYGGKLTRMSKAQFAALNNVAAEAAPKVKVENKAIAPVKVDDDLLDIAIRESANSKYRFEMEIDAQGVLPGKLRRLDDLINKGEYSLEDVAKDWKATRKQIREKYGDEVILYRADAPKSEQNESAKTAYFGEEALAKRFEEKGKNGRKALPYKIPVDDIVAIYAQENGYYEFIIKRPKNGFVPVKLSP